MQKIKKKITNGIKWSAFERFLNIGVNFVISIVIARILSPTDYGVIGMITIFTSISIVFIEGGFSSALIRKQNRTDADYNTVFYYNISVSILLYILIFFSAPLVANFYNISELTIITRIVGLNIFIGAFGTIQTAILNISINFKSQTKISLIALLISGTIGIILAYNGYGVWALIFQGLLTTILRTGLLWYFIGWKPKLIFSIVSFRELFSFGSKMMLSGLLDAIYYNIYQVMIGKQYNAKELGFFTRANGLATLPAQNITDIIIRVAYPVLSEIQNDVKRLETNYRRMLKMLSFIVFPSMMFLFALSYPLIKILLTDKWIPAAPILQVLSFSFMFFPINSINRTLLEIKGRSGLILRIEIFKKILITIVLFATAPFGIMIMCHGIVLTSILSVGINTYYSSKLLNVNFFTQLNDIIPILILSVLSGFVVLVSSKFFDDSWMKLVAGGIIGIVFFLMLSRLLKFNELMEIRNIIFKRHTNIL